MRSPGSLLAMEMPKVAEQVWSLAHQAVENEDVAELLALLSAGGDVNEVEPYSGFSLLHHAIDVERDAAAQTGEPLSVEMTRLLVEHGADLGLRDRDGRSPLQLAVSVGHLPAAEIIRDRQGDP